MFSHGYTLVVLHDMRVLQVPFCMVVDLILGDCHGKVVLVVLHDMVDFVVHDGKVVVIVLGVLSVRDCTEEVVCVWLAAYELVRGCT